MSTLPAAHPPARTSVYLWLILLPVTLLGLGVAALNYATFDSFARDHAAEERAQTRELERVSEAMAFAQELRAIQKRVGETLTKVTDGTMREADAYRVHTELVDRLARLDERLLAMDGLSGDAEALRAVRTDFDAYRTHVVTATDLSAIDPVPAMRHALDAATRHIALAERIGAITDGIQRHVLRERRLHDRNVLDHVLQVTLQGILLIVAFVVCTYACARWFARRLAVMTDALAGLGRGETEPATLPAVNAIAADRRHVLQDMAKTVLAFREAIRARDAAEDGLLRLSLIVEQSPNCILVTDAGGRIEWVNHAFTAHTGFAAEEVIGKNPHVLSSGRTPAGTYESLWATLKRGDSWRGELMNRRKDGAERVHLATIAPLRSHDGRLLNYVSIQQDITETKRLSVELERHRERLEETVGQRTQELREAHDALASTEKFLRAITDNIPVRIMYWDRDGRCRFANRDFYLHGPRIDTPHAVPTAREAVGRTYAEVFGAAFAEAGNRHLAAALRGEALSFERESLTPEGGSVWHEVHFLPDARDDGVHGVFVLASDITSSKEGEIRLQQSSLALARERDRADAANQAKSAFLASMSHEIRTPMNAIIGLAHLLRRSITDPRQAAQVGKISAAAHHLLGVINDILDLSKIEAGKFQLKNVDFRVEDVVDNVSNLVRDRATAKGLELVVDIAGVPESLRGDGLRLGQILLNFAGNAVKFTEYGCVVLRGRVAGEAAGGPRMRFEVADTGIGLTDDQKSRLFRDFEQAEASTATRYGGTGLGLAISRRLTELMGGRIGVESEAGKGSTFWVEIPLGAVEGSSFPTAAAPGTPPKQVLVVDDLPEARRALTEALTMLGLQPTPAADAAEALRLVDEAHAAGSPFDLMLVDRFMPGMDGIALGRELGWREGGRDVPRILVTAGSEEVPDEVLAPAGYACLLHKPVGPSRLREALQGCFAARPAAPGGHRPAEGSSAEARLRARGGRVLLVDDNLMNQEIALELLKGVGLDATVAGNGALAVERMCDGAFDLVLMDMQMPVMDGLEATRRIRALPGLAATVPIVAMTANTYAEDRERCLAAGMNDHLAKPIMPAALHGVLLQWLPERRATAPEAMPEPSTPPLPPPPPSATPTAAAPAAATPVLDLALADIPGIDMQAGLRQALGRETLFRLMLERFVEGQRDFPGRLSAALDAGDRPAAEIAVHTLKGAAAQIGAADMRERAEHLEKALRRRAPPPELEPAIAGAVEAVARLVEAIAARLPGNAPDAAEGDGAHGREACEALARLLASGNPEAAAPYLEEHDATLRLTLRDDYGWIAEALRTGRYAAARDWLREAMARDDGEALPAVRAA